MTIRALVVDDEQLARDELCFLLKSFDEIEVVGQATNGLEAIEMVEELGPDLLFLDIQMPGLDGFQVVRELMGEQDDVPRFVFVTAFDQYAIRAFEVNAVDYLLKPVEKKRLREAVSRAVRGHTPAAMTTPAGPSGNATRAGAGTSLESDSDIKSQLERLLEALEHGRAHRRIVIKVADRFKLVNSDDIVYASVEDGVITIVTTEQRGTSNLRTLDELVALLDPEVFWRVHRSYVVNLHRIREVIPWFNRTIQLKMADSNGSQIPVSRSQTRRLKEHLNL
jgi:two-component system LytT family response regulator/two-component system response regulator LytT